MILRGLSDGSSGIVRSESGTGRLFRLEARLAPGLFQLDGFGERCERRTEALIST